MGSSDFLEWVFSNGANDIMKLFNNCVADIEIISDVGSTSWVTYIGGIVGDLFIGSDIKDGVSTMDEIGGTLKLTNGTNYYYIGLIGAFFDWRELSNVTINNWYSEMDASNAILRQYVGSLIGYHIMNGGSPISVKRGYVALKTRVGAENSVGTLIGYGRNPIVDSVYVDVDTFPGDHSASNVITKTTKELKKQETFIGWDFEDIWIMQENIDYPRLVLLKKLALITCKKVPLNNYRR